MNNTIQTLRTRGERYIQLAKFGTPMILIGLAVFVIVKIGEIAASGFPWSSLVALLGGYLDNDASYFIGLLGDIVGTVLMVLGCIYKSNEDKGYMMLGIAMTYMNTLGNAAPAPAYAPPAPGYSASVPPYNPNYPPHV